eukprot:scaffold11843_cov152-Amphora_coffeaeformis.AAC.8
MKLWLSRSVGLSILSTGLRLSTAFVTTTIIITSRLPKRYVRTRTAMSPGAATQDPPENAPEHVLIAGAGIIGISTAFYLHKQYGIRSTLIDVTGEIAPAASGKAGGFLALDWNDGSPTGPLTHRSFALHQELADELGAESIQYRRLTCAAIVVDVRLTWALAPK